MSHGFYHNKIQYGAKDELNNTKTGSRSLMDWKDRNEDEKITSL